jgi:C4-type Zn-finger protein
MKLLKCPICEANIEIHEKTKGGERLTCPNCFAQLALYKHRGKLVFGCAYCKELVFDPAACDECERRHERKRQLIEEGKL